MIFLAWHGGVLNQRHLTSCATQNHAIVPPHIRIIMNNLYMYCTCIVSKAFPIQKTCSSRTIHPVKTPNGSNSKLAFTVRCACARRSSKQAAASAPTEEAATTLTRQDMTKPRSHVHPIHFEEEILSYHMQCSATHGPAELPLAAPKRPPSRASVNYVQICQA